MDDKMYITCYQISAFEELEKSDLGREKLEFERKNIIKDIVDRATISLKWQIKAHTEMVKVLEYVEEANILMTSSFDRKVKLWKAATGEYLDSLQQNYNKQPPEPLAFYDSKKKYLYTKDRRKAFEGVEITPTDLDFNPFVMNLSRQGREH
jgi:WD40 repeat protein